MKKYLIKVIKNIGPLYKFAKFIKSYGNKKKGKDNEIHMYNAEIYKLNLPNFDCLISDKNTGMAGHLLFLYNLTKETHSKQVIEIGLGGANSSLAFLLALKENNGKLISIDCKPTKAAIDRIEKYNFKDNWELLEGFSQEIVKDISDSLKVDILFIDGKHSYNQCKLDYMLYEPFVIRGGFILFHDSATIKGVIQFTNELKKILPESIQLPYCNGLFVVRKTW